MFANLLKKQARRGFGAVTAKVERLPAPVGGWNARDPMSEMKPDDAVILDNLIPDTGKVRTRPGYLSHATGMTGSHVETLMEYAPPSGTNKLFAAAPANIYDVTAAGAVGAASLSTLSNGRWQHTMFSTTGGNFLCIVNGADAYRTYNGTSWTDQSSAVTGVTSSTLINVSVHGNRLWFVQVNTLDAWYLPTAAITGAATKFPLGPLCKKGGSLLATGTWTVDGGDGSDDKWVAVTSRGEVIVYSGTDPASADTFALVGVYAVAEPVGRRCLIKVGGDLGIITSTGVALLSQLIGVNKSGQKKVTITNKISNAFRDAYRTAGANHGWQIQEFPSQSLVIVNVPVLERVRSDQFVINVETGAWCRFTGINANCWSLKGDQLYFGDSTGTVFEFAGDALTDNGAGIEWTVKPAFNLLKSPQNKTVSMARPLMIGSPDYIPGIEIQVDYDPNPPSVPVPPAAPPSGAALWDTFLWDTTLWATVEGVTLDRWITVDGSGRSISLCMRGIARGRVFELHDADVAFQVGTFL